MAAVDVGTGRRLATLPIKRWARSLALKGTDRLLFATGTEFVIGEVDVKKRTYLRETKVPRQVVDDYVLRRSPPGTRILERDALAVAWFKGRTVVAVGYETTETSHGLLLWLEDQRVETLQGVPENMLVDGDRLVVTILGGNAVAVHDGRTIRHFKVGEGPWAAAKAGSEVVVTINDADEVVWLDPVKGTVQKRVRVGWRYPKGVTTWRDQVLVAAWGSDKKPEGALIRIDASGKQTVLPLGSRNAEAVVVSGDFAFVTCVSDSRMVVVDLRRFVVVHKYEIAFNASPPLLVGA